MAVKKNQGRTPVFRKYSTMKVSSKQGYDPNFASKQGYVPDFAVGQSAHVVEQVGRRLAARQNIATLVCVIY
jgi:hypothetical protein